MSAKPGAQMREQNPNWRGGRSLASSGYILIRVGVEHPLADVRGYAYEHRLVASQQPGRWLEPHEQVHHRDENKRNNAPENLEVLTASEHQFQHRSGERGLRRPGEENPLVSCECGCGETFTRFDASGRPRRFVSGHNPSPRPSTEAVRQALSLTPRKRSDLFLDLPITKHSSTVCLSKLKREGVATNDGRGNWRLCG